MSAWLLGVELPLFTEPSSLGTNMTVLTVCMAAMHRRFCGLLWCSARQVDESLGTDMLGLAAGVGGGPQ